MRKRPRDGADWVLPAGRRRVRHGGPGERARRLAAPSGRETPSSVAWAIRSPTPDDPPGRAERAAPADVTGVSWRASTWSERSWCRRTAPGTSLHVGRATTAWGRQALGAVHPGGPDRAARPGALPVPLGEPARAKGAGRVAGARRSPPTGPAKRAHSSGSGRSRPGHGRGPADGGSRPQRAGARLRACRPGGERQDSCTTRCPCRSSCAIRCPAGRPLRGPRRRSRCAWPRTWSTRAARPPVADDPA